MKNDNDFETVVHHDISYLSNQDISPRVITEDIEHSYTAEKPCASYSISQVGPSPRTMEKTGLHNRKIALLLEEI